MIATGRIGNGGRYVEYRLHDCELWKDTHGSKYIVTSGTPENIETVKRELTVGTIWANEDTAFPGSISITGGAMLHNLPPAP